MINTEKITNIQIWEHMISPFAYHHSPFALPVLPKAKALKI